MDNLSKADLGKVTVAWDYRDKLEELVNLIVEKEDYSVEVIDEAIDNLGALEGLTVKKKTLGNLLVAEDVFRVPDEFKCPISKQIMNDPVILSTGQTYERANIENWLRGGKRTCPRTQQVLSHTLLTPNVLVQRMISRWCRDHAIEPKEPVHEAVKDDITVAERSYLEVLLQRLASSSVSDQREAAKQLRQLTELMPSFRAFFSQSRDAIPKLLDPLSPGRVNSHPDLQEDLITTVMNLSVDDRNKEIIVDTPHAIPLLIESLSCGSIETKGSAAATVSGLAVIDFNKQLLGRLGAIKPLINLIEEGNTVAMKEAASALLSLCHETENSSRAVHDGAVRVIMMKIVNGILVEEMLSLLAALAVHDMAIEEMKELSAVQCLLNLIRENATGSSSENSIAILCSIVMQDKKILREINEEELTNATLSILAKHGTSRAQRKAKYILDKLHKPPLSPRTPRFN